MHQLHITSITFQLCAFGPDPCDLREMTKCTVLHRAEPTRVLQGKRQCEVTLHVYWYLQSKDDVPFIFLCRTSALARARFCKVQSAGVRHWLSLVPCHQRPRRTVIVLQECLTSFGNAEHLPGLELLGWTGQKQAHALHLAQAMLLKDMRKFFILDYEPALALTEASGFCFCTLM